MPADLALDTVYRDARIRISELAAGLTDEELATALPACPEWTAHDVVAHVTGVAVDSVNGRLDGMPGPTWTARQVTERKGKPVPDILDEWAQAGPTVEAGLAARKINYRIVFDILTHEGDLREGLGRPPSQGWLAILNFLATQAVRAVKGTGTLLLHVDGETFRGGEGEPVTEVRVDPYELFRGLGSRRSRGQMRAWDWTGDPTPYLESLPFLGPRDDDQPGGEPR